MCLVLVVGVEGGDDEVDGQSRETAGEIGQGDFNLLSDKGATWSVSLLARRDRGSTYSWKGSWSEIISESQ